MCSDSGPFYTSMEAAYKAAGNGDVLASKSASSPETKHTPEDSESIFHSERL